MDWDNSLFILLTIRDILEINYYIKIGQKRIESLYIILKNSHIKIIISSIIYEIKLYNLLVALLDIGINL